jgi:hypothetical protein
MTLEVRLVTKYSRSCKTKNYSHSPATSSRLIYHFLFLCLLWACTTNLTTINLIPAAEAAALITTTNVEENESTTSTTLADASDSTSSNASGSSTCLKSPSAETCSSSDATIPTTSTTNSPPKQLKCNYYYDWSAIPNAGLGLFTARYLPPRVKVGYPDLAIHVVDPPPAATGLKLFLYNYAWDATLTGGQYEGDRYVAVAIPGVGMLANGRIGGNIIPLHRLAVDEADLPRTEAPGAGAITHYYNMTFYTAHTIEAGEELVVNYGEEWFEERKLLKTISAETITKSSSNPKYTVERLKQHGLCADNIQSDASTLPGAGRGAFATRFIPKGALIAPIPLLPLNKQSLEMLPYQPSNRKSKKKSTTSGTNTQQLLLNYCFGHKRSSLLFFPYSGGVNFINSSPDQANAVLQWSNHPFHQKTWLNQSAAELLANFATGLMLDLIATRDILPGEEIFMDYGPDWHNAWNRHVEEWIPVEDADQYSPSYVMNDVVDLIRTQEEEAKFYPYPDNLQTACFYKYKKQERKDATGITMIPWKPSAGIHEFRYLRPCTILKREQETTLVGHSGSKSRYTVQMWNRANNMTPADERFPKEEERRHIVDQVPRLAIRFVDKPYTTDPHLPNAFRHWIGLPPGLFPEAWMDLK